MRLVVLLVLLVREDIRRRPGAVVLLLRSVAVHQDHLHKVAVRLDHPHKVADHLDHPCKVVVRLRRAELLRTAAFGELERIRLAEDLA